MTNFFYPDPLTVERQRKIDNARWTDLFVRFDGLGRNKQQLNSDPQGVVFVDTTYDGVGRRATVSNPYRSTTDPTYGITTFGYDALGRVTQVIPPDGSATANNVSTVYTGNCTTVTDQAGKKRKSCTDALERLTQVFEPDANQNLVFETDYQYDLLDNLTRVDQKGNDPSSANWRTRTFAYNSLSQLLSAGNPESGTIQYTYDADGNLLTKTDARNITTTHSYDALHRLTGKTFSNLDPALSYFYDQATYNGLTITNGIGRRTGMSDAAGAEAWSYDQMGRPATDRRTTNGVTKATSYTYNLDGSVATLTYPSGRMITYTPDAAGRMLSAVDTANGINYATGAAYTPHGALSSLTLGQSATFGGINLNQGFNSRLQPATIRAWSTNGVALDLAYGFNLGTANNGNVAAITNNLVADRTQSFTYDESNRIKTAKTQATTGTYAWGLQFGYDIWANLLSATVTQGSAPMLSVGVNNQNKVTNTGFSYDAAGNVLGDGSYSYSWDAESRMKTAAGVTYTYDGDGKRVQKSNGKLYWYGMGADPLAESDAAGNITDEYIFFGGKRIARLQLPASVNYYFADHLSTARVVTSATGGVLDDSDFYPFGGERPVVSTTGNTYKFTGKERDSESGLDYFGARYYASTMGRFSSADPKGLGLRHLLNPQKLNKYSYVLNNPLSLFDPNGMEEITITYRTFIPAQSFTYLGKNYSGDGRGFSTAANASSRSSITVKLETDASKRPGNPIISVTSSAGPSQRLDANGNVTREATATVGLPTATGTRDANGNPVINISQDTKNPLSPVPQFMTPGISANLSVTVPQDASSAQVTGTASVFPAQELNVTRADGNTTPVLQFEPAPGATPTDLFRRDRPVDAQKPTPQCSTDDKGKKVCSQ